jgi:hypothetical protein
MTYDFEYLKAMAFDPFARSRALAARQGLALEARAEEDARLIANGDWSEADCCCDPGPDEFPEVEPLALTAGQ